MIIHIWMHWFWITLVCKGILLTLSKQVFCSTLVAEAGLPDAFLKIPAEDSVPDKDELFNYTSQNGDDVKVRLRRTVEDEDVPEEEATTVAVVEGSEAASNETMSGESDVYRGPVSSDVEDTYGGAAGDAVQVSLKKYTKYTKYGRLKSKPKTPEEVVAEEAEGNLTSTTDRGSGEAPANATAETPAVERNETATAAAGNETEPPIVAEEGNTNRTANGTREETFEVDYTTDVPVVNVTEGQSEAAPTVVNLTVENKLDESVIHTTVEQFLFNNGVAAATSSETRERLSHTSLDAGSITGITLGIVVISGFIGAISFVLYRRRYLNKPQALNDKCSNLDSSGYIDETSLRENSEEMYSLDNDSFLNSLEAMTIQNYWTENVKHTKL